MADPRPMYPCAVPTRPPLTYGVLEPGLQAAVDLLRREALNEQKAGEILESQDKIPGALEHAANFQAYTRSIALLNEQMDRLKAVSTGKAG